MKAERPVSFTMKQTVHFLKKHDNFCILTHSSPDGDTLGSAAALAYGLRSIGKHCFVRCGDEIPAKFFYFMREDLLTPMPYETVVAVDVADERLLGSLMVGFAGKVDLCIDHHVSNTGYAEKLYLDAGAAATCECIFELLGAAHIALNDTIAAALYTGISTDTGCFKYSNVTARTHRIAAELYGYDIHAADICKAMFDTKSKGRLELERMVLDSARFYFDEECMVLTVTTDMLEKTGCCENDLEGVAVLSRCVEGVIAGVSLKQKDENTFRVSLRTYDPLDASAICRRLGGGGHRAAAGCTLTGSVGDVTAQVLEAIGEALEESHAGTSAHQ